MFISNFIMNQIRPYPKLIHTDSLSFFGKQIFSGVALVLFLFAVSCSSSTDTGNNFPPVEGFEADLGNDTVLLEEDVVTASLIHTDEENFVYTFHADVLREGGVTLREGEIMLLANKALRRITSVSESGGQLVVETEFAALNEAFENAVIESSQYIDFRQMDRSKIMLEFDGNLLPPNVAAKDDDSGQTKWEYKFGDFTIEGTLNSKTDEAKIALLVKYKTGDVSGAMLSELTLKGFENDTRVRITDHKTESFRFNNSGLEGKLDMRFIFAGGRSKEESWAPPMPAIIVPFTVGLVPFTLRIGPVFVYKIQLGADGTAQFETSFSFGGGMGVQVDGASFTPILEGGIRNPAYQQAVGNAAGFGGTVSGQYGIALPSVTLNAFGEAIVPYLNQEFYLGASYTFPTCTQLWSRYEINAGVKMKMFGLANLNFSQNLVKETMHDYRSDGCPPRKSYDEIPLIYISDYYSPASYTAPGFSIR